MFERYTEKARRVIFCSRYEASQFGSPYIETEHLLLGLLREDRALRGILRDTGAESVRAEIERRITRSESFATSVEVPLSADSKKVLHFAAEEADRLGQRHIGTEHMLLGLLRVQGSLGAQVARARGLKAERVARKACKRTAAGGFLEAVPSDTGSTGRFLDGTEVALRSGFDGIFR